MAYALLTLGYAEQALGHIQEADDSYSKALDIRQELDQLNLAAEVHAGMARLGLDSDDLERAQKHAEAIFAYLETGSLEGTLEPLRVYLTCVWVLQALEDPRATAMLDKANLLVHQQAYRIQDQILKNVYFASPNVAAIRELQAKEIS
jgi:hypothetical protein